MSNAVHGQQRKRVAPQLCILHLAIVTIHRTTHCTIQIKRSRIEQRCRVTLSIRLNMRQAELRQLQAGNTIEEFKRGKRLKIYMISVGLRWLTEEEEKSKRGASSSPK